MTTRSAKLRVPADLLDTLSELGSGGQGKVYELSGRAPGLQALPYTNLVYKEYIRSVRTTLDPDVLDEMSQYAARLTSGPEGLGDRLAWPLATVEQEGTVSGFLMRRASQQFVVQLQLPSGAKATLAEAQLLLNDEQYLADRRLPVHDRWRLQFLRDTADTLAQLHRNGIIVGDLSPKNLLASFTTRPYCFFLDCDAMRISGRSVLSQVETTGWEVPNDEERATIASDAYKLALLAIRLFTGDQESKDITALSAVYPALGQLALKGISTDPSARPTPVKWLPILDAAIPGAMTALPLQRIRGSAGGAAPAGNPVMSSSAAAPRPGGWRGAPPIPPSTTRAPVGASALGNLGKMLGIVLIGFIGLLFLIGVPTQTKTGSPGAGPSATPVITNPADPAEAHAELDRLVMADSAEVRSVIAERWVPQLASARKGLVVNGVVFDYTDILKEHQAVRKQYPNARLVWSGDWTVFNGRDFFVTVLAVPFGTAEGANRWCDQQGIDRDHCFAKLLSQVRDPAGTTRHR
jgi:eukaryotic-like serine/threonine-protein kinase